MVEDEGEGNPVAGIMDVISLALDLPEAIAVSAFASGLNAKSEAHRTQEKESRQREYYREGMLDVYVQDTIFAYGSTHDATLVSYDEFQARAIEKTMKDILEDLHSADELMVKPGDPQEGAPVEEGGMIFGYASKYGIDVVTCPTPNPPWLDDVNNLFPSLTSKSQAARLSNPWGQTRQYWRHQRHPSKLQDLYFTPLFRNMLTRIPTSPRCLRGTNSKGAYMMYTPIPRPILACR